MSRASVWRMDPPAWQPPARSRRWFICRDCDTASPGVDAHRAHQRSCLLYGQRLADMEGKP